MKPSTRLADVLGADAVYRSPGYCEVTILKDGEVKVEIDGLLKLRVIGASAVNVINMTKGEDHEHEFKDTGGIWARCSCGAKQLIVM